MKNKYYLPGLNANQRKQSDLSFEINKDEAPEAYMFYKDTSAFYRTYCDGLDHIKLREKRFLDFETPNRALITHEYDLRIVSSFEYAKFYYLFNPTERLSWLKISQEGKRLSVADSLYVKGLIEKILVPELTLIYSDPNVKFEELWNKKKGLPCFIKLEKIGHNDCLLTASYYDSIKQQEDDKSSIINPLSERSIKYEYLPLKNKSSWLYIKAPSSFNIKYNHKETIYGKDNNEIDYANAFNEEADPEKTSLTIINKKSTTTKEDTVVVNFDILVPASLKIWFLSIYILTLATLCMLIGYFVNALYVLCFEPIFNANPLDVLIKSPDFGGLVLAVIGAIIATRGWLITEETILRKYSKYITLMMVFIIILYILMLLLKPIL